MTVKKLMLYAALILLAVVGFFVLVKILAALSFAFFLGVAVGAAGAFTYVYKFNKNKRNG